MPTPNRASFIQPQPGQAPPPPNAPEDPSPTPANGSLMFDTTPMPVVSPVARRAPSQVQWDEAYSLASGNDASAAGLSQLPGPSAEWTGDRQQVGPYRLRELIGEDGMGWTYRAKDVNLRRQFAVKVIKPEAKQDEYAWQQFWNEARAAAGLQNPRVATYQIGEDRGMHYLAMELLKGESLKTRMARGPLSLRQSIWVVREAALALATAHRAGLIHRDIKPSNLWLEPADGAPAPGDTGALTFRDDSMSQVPAESARHDRFRLLDFSLMKVDCDSYGRIKRPALIGSPIYLAPEQAANSPGDARSDLFSLGVILFQLTTGKLPFSDTTLRDIMAEFASASAPLASQLNPNLPTALVALIKQMLSRRPEERPHSAAEVAEALSEIEKKLSTRQANQSNKLRWLFAAIPASLVVLSILTGIAFWIARSPSYRSDQVTAPAEQIFTPKEVLGKVGDRVTVEFKVKSAVRGANGGMYLTVTEPNAGTFRAVLSEETCNSLRARGLTRSEQLAGAQVRAHGPVIQDDGYTVLQISGVEQFDKLTPRQ